MNHLERQKEILEQALDYAIELHLEIGETEESMLKQFNGNKIEMANYLRERSAKKGIPESISTVGSVSNKYEALYDGPKRKRKKTKDFGSKNGLFD